MRTCDFWSTDFPGLHFEPLRFHYEHPRLSRPFLEPLKILNFYLNVNAYPDPSIHLIRIRIQLPKPMRIRIRNPGLDKNKVPYPVQLGSGFGFMSFKNRSDRCMYQYVLKELSLQLKLFSRIGLDGEKAELSGSAEQSQRATSPNAASRLILHSESTQCSSSSF